MKPMNPSLAFKRPLLLNLVEFGGLAAGEVLANPVDEELLRGLARPLLACVLEGSHVLLR